MVSTGQRLLLITWNATPVLKLSNQCEVLRVAITMRSALTRSASKRMPSAANPCSRTHSGSHHSRATSGTNLCSAPVNLANDLWLWQSDVGAMIVDAVLSPRPKAGYSITHGELSKYYEVGEPQRV
jgi:hypothetical protein